MPNSLDSGGLRVGGIGFRGFGLGNGPGNCHLVYGLGLGFWGGGLGLGFWGWGFEVWGLGLGFWGWDVGCEVWGLGFGV